MSLTKQFKTSEETEKNGYKFQLPANDDGTIPTFYIARMSATNTVYQKALEKASAPYRNELRLGVLDKAVDRQIMRESFVDGKILVGWENVLAADVPGCEEIAKLAPVDGVDHKATFNRKNALALLESLPELHNLFVGVANNMNNYLEANREETAKN